MSCKQNQKQLPLAAGGDLDAAELAEVERHTAECLECYRELQRYRAALEPLRRLRDGGEVPDRLLCDVLSAIDAERRTAVAAPAFSRRGIAALAAGVFLAVLAGSQWTDRSRSDEGSQGDAFPGIAGTPFDLLSDHAAQVVRYPVQRDVFGGASPVLLPAVAAPAADVLPNDDYYRRIRRSQSPIRRVSAQADDF